MTDVFVLMFLAGALFLFLAGRCRAVARAGHRRANAEPWQWNICANLLMVCGVSAVAVPTLCFFIAVTH